MKGSNASRMVRMAVRWTGLWLVLGPLAVTPAVSEPVSGGLAGRAETVPEGSPLSDPSAAPADADGQTQWEIQSVRELMRRDLETALREPRGRGPSSPVRVQSALAPRLVALYGVGKALMAEVQVADRAYLYVRGQTYPAGYQDDGSVYQLRGMNGACIQLERGQDRHSLCLRLLLGTQTP